MPYELEYHENGNRLAVDAQDACLGLLLALESGAKRPIGVYLTRPEGESLSCVLGASKTAFVWYPPQYDGIGTWASHTDTPSEKTLDFWLCGSHTQAPQDSQVDRFLLDEVVQEFLESGARSRRIGWRPD